MNVHENTIYSDIIIDKAFLHNTIQSEVEMMEDDAKITQLNDFYLSVRVSCFY